MAISIDVYDYNSLRELENGCFCAYGIIHYSGHNDTFYVEDRNGYGNARLVVNNSRWWVGCQHAIKFVWASGEEVILKTDNSNKIWDDCISQNKIVDYLKQLGANGFKYIPFGEPARNLELSGVETEFMDI